MSINTRSYATFALLFVALTLSLVAAPIADAAPAAPPEQRLLLCGAQLAASVDVASLPYGLPSSRCSLLENFGDGLSRATTAGAPQFEATRFAKAHDSNSLTFRQSLLQTRTLGTLYLHVLIEDPSAGTLESFRVEIGNALVMSIGTGTDGDEQLEIEGSNLRWGSFTPPAPPKMGPNSSFCWDLASGRSC